MTGSNSSPWKVRMLAAGGLLAVFFAGILAGTGLYHGYRFAEPPRPRPGPPHAPPPVAPLPLEELGLTADQWEKARGIMDAHRPELDEVLRATYPRVRAISDRIEQEVRKILTPEQARRLDEIKARRPPPGGTPPWAGMHPGGGPGGPGGPPWAGMHPGGGPGGPGGPPWAGMHHGGGPGGPGGPPCMGPASR